jgi:2-phospho-L-lactate transferase/gluconeogenesis factor (CofD/UPF0052 family)
MMHDSSLKPLVIFKGGAAFNGLLRHFQAHFPHSAYIVPITDDGGSSREIGRVFGGPSIGDLRSTLTRLSDESTAEACAVKKLLEHRLSRDNLGYAMAEWHAFLQDEHALYDSISSKYRGLIRTFLCKFETERLYRISYQFDMRNGSIGNFFFSGARMVLGSLETAIFMYSSVARIPNTAHVLPIIDSNERLGIGVQLENGEAIIGQHMISHPTDHGHVDKNTLIPLPARIKKLYYIDKFNNKIEPKPHTEVLRNIKQGRGIIYGMGSLWTSIIPSLVLEGVGEAIAALKGPKVMLLNCCHDRETLGMTGKDMIEAICTSLNRYAALSHPPHAYISHLFVVEGTAIAVDEQAVEQWGIQICRIPADRFTHLSIQNKQYSVYSSQDLIQSISCCLNHES